MAQLAAFTTNNLTAQQIVKAADREAGNPGLYLNDSGVEALTAPGYVKLQMILDDESLVGDWPFRSDGTSIAVSANTRTVGLPSDYWASRLNTFWWIDAVTGGRTPLRLQDRESFHADILPTNQGKATPQAVFVAKNQGAADGGTPSGVLMVNPVSATSGLVEVHYSPIADPLASITEKPWFPYTLYLEKRLVAEMFMDQDDDRADRALGIAAALLKRIKLSSADPGQRSRAIPVSRDVFRNPVRI